MHVAPIDWGGEAEPHQDDPKFILGRKGRFLTLLKASGSVTLKVGVPWTKKEFVERAIEVEHPFYDWRCAVRRGRS